MLKDKEKFISIAGYIASSVGILFLIYFLAGRPVINHSSKLKKEFNSRQAKLKESESLIRSLPNPTKAIEDIETKVQEFKDMGVGRRQLPKLIQVLAGLTSKSNINVISIRPRDDIHSGNENLPQGISKVYIEMILNCNYKTFGEYIKSLNEMPASFSIETITIDKKEDSIDTPEAKKLPEKTVDKPVNLLITLLLSTYMVWEL
ncbi:MAG: type 4a pilus biogenesis protein PilO [Candidatus Omnitrophota bacterium]|nr:type 4a pilus biogenesis protein PilO [Candidatus Omnitrophota bacterium]MBU1929500.1 type 4a pilus biogenesis protein PilO [Candidatus Omnitrophota bacterium]MBU2035153.1 type 4a pilus biogenesis protein PilO [Candidatus Omnitrophota bacterium]MBU2222063.1 type 4a pilus biogenesis protein PilO [Candidatus Omnitrophota bacterium]